MKFDVTWWRNEAGSPTSVTTVYATDATEAEALVRALTAGAGPSDITVRRVEPSGPRPHDCEAHAVPYTSDGPLGHGWECGICGAFLQAG